MAATRHFHIHPARIISLHSRNSFVLTTLCNIITGCYTSYIKRLVTLCNVVYANGIVLHYRLFFFNKLFTWWNYVTLWNYIIFLELICNRIYVMQYPDDTLYNIITVCHHVKINVKGYVTIHMTHHVLKIMSQDQVYRSLHKRCSIFLLTKHINLLNKRGIIILFLNIYFTKEKCSTRWDPNPCLLHLGEHPTM